MSGHTHRKRLAAAFLAAAALAGCQSQSARPPFDRSPGGKSAALLAMEQVATAAYRCWFASRDEAFRNYSFANELNSFTGRPRFLVVPRNDFGGRPLLVVQSEGAEGRVSAFGPLMEGAFGARIANDLGRWSAGDPSCRTGA